MDEMFFGILYRLLPAKLAPFLVRPHYEPLSRCSRFLEYCMMNTRVVMQSPTLNATMNLLPGGIHFQKPNLILCCVFYRSPDIICDTLQ